MKKMSKKDRVKWLDYLYDLMVNDFQKYIEVQRQACGFYDKENQIDYFIENYNRSNKNDF